VKPFARHCQTFLYGLLALAVLLQGAIPAGFMPDFSKGRAEIVICTSAGAETILIDAKGLPLPKSKHDAGKRNACPYAPVLAQKSAPPVTVAVPAQVTMPEPVRAADVLAASSRPKPWFSQGPPSA
jgi:hypothetical protein